MRENRVQYIRLCIYSDRVTATAARAASQLPRNIYYTEFLNLHVREELTAAGHANIIIC